MNQQAKLIEAVLAAPADRQAEALRILTVGADRPRPGTLAAAAKLAGVHKATVRRWASRGLLNPVHLSRKTVRVDLREVEALLSRGAESRGVMA